MTQPGPLHIVFKAKVTVVWTHDEPPTEAWREVKIPKITRSHVNDLYRLRTTSGWSAFANSDLMPGLLRGVVRHRIPRLKIHEDNRLIWSADDPLPEGVLVDESGFLATVTIDLPEWEYYYRNR